MSLETWLLFLTVTTAASLLPGPNLILAMASGLTHGPRGTVWTVAGLVIGGFGVIALTLAGFSAILLASETAYLAVKWAGVAYLVYLAWKMWHAPPPVVDVAAAETPRASGAKLFLQALACMVTNPKAILFVGALFPQFIDPARDFLTQASILAVTAMTMETLVMTAAGLGAARLARYFARRGRGTLLNKIAGGALVGAAGLLAVARQ